MSADIEKEEDICTDTSFESNEESETTSQNKDTDEKTPDGEDHSPMNTGCDSQEVLADSPGVEEIIQSTEAVPIEETYPALSRQSSQSRDSSSVKYMSSRQSSRLSDTSSLPSKIGLAGCLEDSVISSDSNEEDEVEDSSFHLSTQSEPKSIKEEKEVVYVNIGKYYKLIVNT